MMTMMIKPWLVWNRERMFTWPFTKYEGGNDPKTGKIPNGNRTGLIYLFTWPFTKYEGGNDPKTGKIPNGNRTGLIFATTRRNALSIKLLESRPLWGSFQAIARIISTFMSLSEVQNIRHFIYFHSCLGTERCNKRKLIHILRGRPFNSWGGGGGWVILKKNFLQALVGRKKLHAAQM